MGLLAIRFSTMLARWRSLHTNIRFRLCLYCAADEFASVYVLGSIAGDVLRKRTAPASRDEDSHEPEDNG